MYCCLRLIYTRCDWLWWMEDRETPRMNKYGASKTTRIMMATVRHVTSSSGLRKYQVDGFLFDWVYLYWARCIHTLSRIACCFISVSLWNRNLTLENVFWTVFKKREIFILWLTAVPLAMKCVIHEQIEHSFNFYWCEMWLLSLKE